MSSPAFGHKAPQCSLMLLLHWRSQRDLHQFQLSDMISLPQPGHTRPPETPTHIAANPNPSIRPEKGDSVTEKPAHQCPISPPRPLTKSLCSSPLTCVNSFTTPHGGKTPQVISEKHELVSAAASQNVKSINKKRAGSRQE